MRNQITEARDRITVELIREALRLCHGNVSATARSLGVPVRHMWRDIRRYGVDLARERAALSHRSTVAPPR